MITLGVTGGIGSGKSAVTAILRELGARVFDADLEARRIMETDPAVRRELQAAFGDDAFREDGRLDRAYLASRVFGDDEQVRRLNEIVHPRVHDAFERARREAEKAGVEVMVHEAALIFESGGERFLDAVAVVDAPEGTRIARTMARDGVTAEQVRARMRHQLPAEEVKRRADYVLDNAGSKQALRARVEGLFRTLAAGDGLEG